MKKAKWKNVVDGVWALAGEHGEICVSKNKDGKWVAYKPHAHWVDGMMAGVTGEKSWHVELQARTLEAAQREAVGLVRESLQDALAALP